MSFYIHSLQNSELEMVTVLSQTMIQEKIHNIFLHWFQKMNS